MNQWSPASKVGACPGQLQLYHQSLSSRLVMKRPWLPGKYDCTFWASPACCTTPLFILLV